MTISANVIPKSTVAKSQNKRALPKATEDDEQEKMVEQGNDMVVFSEAKRPRLEEAINQ